MVWRKEREKLFREMESESRGGQKREKVINRNQRVFFSVYFFAKRVQFPYSPPAAGKRGKHTFMKGTFKSKFQSTETCHVTRRESQIGGVSSLT